MYIIERVRDLEILCACIFTYIRIHLMCVYSSIIHMYKCIHIYIYIYTINISCIHKSEIRSQSDNSKGMAKVVPG